MIIPVRCFNCGKPIAHLYFDYLDRLQKKKSTSINPLTTITQISNHISEGHKTPEDEVCSELGIDRICCRRMILTHIDFTDII
jgi:DNA-directed RNA polymerase subunit N (RpoN/RPB10)